MPARKPLDQTLILLVALTALFVASCGADSAPVNSSENNVSTNNQMSPNNTIPNNNATGNNTTPGNNAADMGAENNTAANSTTPGNNTSPGNNTTPGNNINNPEPPPFRNGAPWPKFRANAEQSGRVSFSLVDDGSDLWSFATSRGIFSSPVVDGDGNIYIGSGDSVFYSLDRDGGTNWSFETGEVIDSSALLDDMNQVIFGSGDGKLYALDATTGMMNWAFEADSPASTGAYINWWEGNVAMGSDGNLIAGNDNFNLYIVNRVDGTRIKRIRLLDQTWSNAAIDIETGDFFIGNNNLIDGLPNMFSYDREGNERWTDSTMGSVVASPIVFDDRVIAGSFDGSVRAWDKDTGMLLWSYQTRDHLYASPAQLSDGTIVQASADGTVYGIDVNTGVERWAFDWGAPIRSSPAIDGDDNIYFGTGDGHLVTLDDQGMLRWALRLIDGDRDDLNSSPALSPSAIHIAGESGEVFRVPADFCLRPAQAGNTACLQGPNEPAAPMGVSLLYTTRFGTQLETPPTKASAHDGLTFTLRVREMGDTVLALFDDASLQVTLDPPIPAKVTISADRQFIVVVPEQEFVSDMMGNVSVQVQGSYLIDPMRTGLKTTGGTVDGNFLETFVFELERDRNEMSFYPFPEDHTAAAGVLWLHRLAAPLPTLLPSYNQIGFDSLDYLIVFVEGVSNQGTGWVVEAAPTGPNGELEPVPQTGGVFPVSLDYNKGRWVMAASDGFSFEVLNFSLGFDSFRVAFDEELDGSLVIPADVTVETICADIPVYGDFLRDLGLCNPNSDVLIARGAALLSPHEGGSAMSPGLFTDAVFSVENGHIVAALTESRIDPDAHYVGLMLIDDITGEPVAIDDIGAKTTLNMDATGNVSRVRLRLDAALSGRQVRAYLITETYPAASATLALP